MQLPNYFNRPEYVFRPWQIYHRLLRSGNKETNRIEDIQLPWNVTIKICPSSNEVVGRSLWLMGIYDLVVTEILWRLIVSDETVIDVGASLGYMTTIMAKKVGQIGKVLCFEPNPDVYKELTENVSNWQKNLAWNQINTQQIALSNKSGVGLLSVPSTNREEAALVSSSNLQSLEDISESYTVTLARLDEILKTSVNIGLMKIDVEGHELEVLQGATELISNQQIRDIVYEDHSGYPTPVSQFLEQHGYTIFRIWKGFWKPLLEHPSKKLVHQWEPPSYLATKEPTRAIELLKKRGWSSLQG
jgi:FkbM family methyltransferase